MAIKKFLENVNKWRKANDLAEVNKSIEFYPFFKLTSVIIVSYKVSIMFDFYHQCRVGLGRLGSGKGGGGRRRGSLLQGPRVCFRLWMGMWRSSQLSNEGY